MTHNILEQLISSTSFSSTACNIRSTEMKRPAWLTKHLNEKMVSCAFETLFTMNVPHVLERIFFSLDYKSFKKCKKVCAQWSALLNSESFRTGAKSHFAAEIASEQRDLRDAAYGGRVDEIKKLVSSGMVDLNFCGGGIWGSTPLCAASKNDNKSAVKALLQLGADVDAPDRAGHTPLMWAATFGNHKMGRILHDAGARPDKANEEGRTPLHLAASVGHGKMAKFLLDYGAGAQFNRLAKILMKHPSKAYNKELKKMSWFFYYNLMKAFLKDFREPIELAPRL